MSNLTNTANVSLSQITSVLQNFRPVIAKRDEYENTLSQFDEIIDDSKEPLLVMVMGAFSTGKSTFINALVRKNIVATDAKPTTAIITKLCYGAAESVIVHYKDGSTVENPQVDFFELTRQTNTNSAKLDEIAYVERRIPLDMLKIITIIDSPGLNSIYEKHGITTQKFMKKADLIVWMFRADNALTAVEAEAIEKLPARLETIAIVNMMDNFNEDDGDEEEFLNDIRKKLKKKAKKVIGISSKYALEGALKNDAKKFAASNISEFYKTLKEDVFPNITTYKMNTIIDGLIGFLFDIAGNVEGEKNFVEELIKEDLNEYKLASHKFLEFENQLKSMVSPFYEYCLTSKDGVISKSFMATLYYTGILLNKDLDRGVRYAEEAAAQNDIAAIFILLTIYRENGDTEKCKYWFNKLLEHDGADVNYVVGTGYMTGKFGVAQNQQKALEYLKKSDMQGSAEGTYYLALSYLNGYGTTVNTIEGFNLLQKSEKLLCSDFCQAPIFGSFHPRAS